MIQTSGKIYLSERRGITDLGYYQSFHTFNFGDYFDESRSAFGSLIAFNDTILKAGSSILRSIEQNSLVILVPLLGGLEYKNCFSHEFIQASEIHSFELAKDTSFEIINPYETETINFLEIWIKNNLKCNTDFMSKIQKNNINFDSQINKLTGFSENCFLGKFDARKHGNYTLKNPNNGVFIFVLLGVFEVQNRLLHARDGLSLWQLLEVEFEALSSESIILMLEICLDNLPIV